MKVIIFIIYLVLLGNLSHAQEIGGCNSHISSHNLTKFYSETGLFGVDEYKLQILIDSIKIEYGENLLGVYAIGSRASGFKSVLKGRRPVSIGSDLDLVILLKSGTSGDWDSAMAFRKKLSENLGFSVELHSTISSDGAPYRDIVMSYHGQGTDAYFPIVTKDLLRESRFENMAIVLFTL